ncbi:hypothetical protein [Acuticoccus kandeliae]|uniref:hypothetical protein n=1 Tax=Acuticoccus kandeliae TaxID=2073160 RepID=UPI000D3E90F6|nr:hypothetical protein [Acuticoccus kandeliae]
MRVIEGTDMVRRTVLPEAIDGRAWLAAGRRCAETVRLGPSPWLSAAGVACERDLKEAARAAGRVTFHAQIGYRGLDISARAWAEIHDRLAEHGAAPDRYGICLDWSMGYPAADRAGRPRGTGLIMDDAADFRRLTGMAPVAPHFGDFVLGMPAALENTAAALQAGATAIGNMAQYFTFRLPHWADDVATTRATVEALGLIAGQSVPILVHSNLDDGYAAWFENMGTTIGFAMIERWLVEELVGTPLAHCYGHTFTDPVKRMAFHFALSEINPTPGSMIYGNTTLYGAVPAANWGALASYMTVDALSLMLRPTGHALTPIPVTEAQRIPAVEEIVEAHLAARRVVERAAALRPLIDTGRVEAMAADMLATGRAFHDRVREGLDDLGYDLGDPAAVMLALRRIGPLALEARFGGPSAGAPVTSPFVSEIDALASDIVAGVADEDRRLLAEAGGRVVIATTDVHFYGKRLLGIVLARLGIEAIDAGVSVDPDALADFAVAAGGDAAIAISTYNGVALSFARALKGELSRRGVAPPVFIGGRLNEIMDDTHSPLPVAVDNEIRQLGITPCASVEDLIGALAARARAGRAPA